MRSKLVIISGTALVAVAGTAAVLVATGREATHPAASRVAAQAAAPSSQKGAAPVASAAGKAAEDADVKAGKGDEGDVVTLGSAHLPTRVVSGHIADLVLRNGREGGHSGSADPDAGGAAGVTPEIQAYADRAYPFAAIGNAQVRRSQVAAERVGNRHHRTAAWRELGPFTLNVDKLATQTSNRPTQWSGRVTALAADPRCTPTRCALYVAAAGGGIWRSGNALASKPRWQFVSGDIPSTAIGSLFVDPTDRTGRTLYAGTGEESGSSDSEAGVGLYRSTDAGRHWTLVPGSPAVSTGRSIGAVVVDPSDPEHLLIGTDVARHGASSVNGGRFTPPAGPAVGLYESTDGGASFHSTLLRPSDTVDPTTPTGGDYFRGGVTDVEYDPSDPHTLYVAMTDYGLFRSSDNGATFDQPFIAAGDDGSTGVVAGIRYELAAVKLASGATRIYLAEGSNEVLDDAGNLVDASKLWRTDDARTASPQWQNLSSPDPTKPGFGSFDFCEGQCSYDMFVASPPGQPNTVWLGGSMHYDELALYAGADRSDGRAVVRSTDAGVNWTDMTGDARPDFEDQHPDTHDIAFAGPDIAFVGSDGGVIRTSGTYSDASSQCDTRGLAGADLADCHAWLSAVPSLLIPVNAGLRTLQFESVSVDPQNPLADLLGGTQDNATQAFTGSPTWHDVVTGDGGNSGIDAGNPDVRYHTYYGPQGDVNFHGNNPQTWDWYMDPLIFSNEAASFYVPFLADPKVSGTAYTGLEHIWRTRDSGGDPSFLDNHCYTNGGPKGDALFTGACGDWVALDAPAGGRTLTGTDYGASRAGDYLASTDRAPGDTGTLWTSTRRGRVFITKNADATGAQSDFPSPLDSTVTLHSEDDVVFTRIDDGESAAPVSPQRFVSGISVDARDPNHALISYSGYDAYATAAGTPTGHVFDVRYDASTGHATWTNISYDLGDQPITAVRFDARTGDAYVATDFGVDVLRRGSTTWVPAAAGLPPVAVYGLTLARVPDSRGRRVLYAATHGRGVYRLILR